MEKNVGTELTNLGKREQVKKANKLIFFWVLGASVLIVICAVAATFLIRQALFNQKIINQKSETNKIVKQNIQTADELKKNVHALLADTNLAALKVAPTDTNLKVVFDALPSTNDATALSNSLYTKIFGTAGVSTTSIGVTTDPAVLGDPSASTPAAAGTTSAPVPTPMPFQATVTGSNAAVAAMFRNFERSIRPMNITLFTIKVGTGDSLSVDINGETYYLSADTVSLGKKPVKP